jgi:hypothetical protein
MSLTIALLLKIKQAIAAMGIQILNFILMAIKQTQ